MTSKHDPATCPRCNPSAATNNSATGSPPLATPNQNAAPYTTTPPKPIATKTTQPITHVAIVMDNSGSMGGIRDAAINAYNAQIAALRDSFTASGQLATLTRSLFPISSVYSATARADVGPSDPVAEAQPLTSQEYRANGVDTPLFIATRHTIETLRSRFGKDPNAAFLVLVLTDGYDTTGQHELDKLREELARCETEGRWTVAFLVPPGRYRADLAARLGHSIENIREWAQTTHGIAQAAKEQSAAIATYVTQRSAGVRSTSKFYTDLSNVDVDEVRRRCVDIRSKVRYLEVKNQGQIEDVVRAAGYDYRAGCAYYLLMKPEKIQGSKEILLVEKGAGASRAVYSGAGARELLGLPKYGEIKVTPGNHGNFDVYVQSTSTNRKCIPGTKLIVQVSL